jgi:GntR family transcriptional regulator, carbon starvation induced regulator
VQAEHRALAEATLNRDAASASSLLEEHYRRTAESLSAAIGAERGEPFRVRLTG